MKLCKKTSSKKETKSSNNKIQPVEYIELDSKKQKENVRENFPFENRLAIKKCRSNGKIPAKLVSVFPHHYLFSFWVI